MAEQAERGKSVLELQCLSAAREAAEKRQKNRNMLLKLLRSVYFLVKNRNPQSTIYRQLVELQVTNGDQLLEQHINQHPLNAQYTSRYSATMLIEAIDTWLERKLLQSLKSSHCYTILADECQDISSQEELSICFRWLVNGCPEEHYLTTLHVKSTDAETITGAIISYMSKKNLEYNYIESLLDRVTMGQQLSRGTGWEFRKECVCMQDMHYTYTVLATDYNLPLSRQQSL